MPDLKLFMSIILTLLSAWTWIIKNSMCSSKRTSCSIVSMLAVLMEEKVNPCMYDPVTCRTARTAIIIAVCMRAEMQFNLAWGGVSATVLQIVIQMRQSHFLKEYGTYI